jgi:glutaminase
MVLCGMNIHSGKFTRSIGLPMKNSITGGSPF